MYEQLLRGLEGKQPNKQKRIPGKTKQTEKMGTERKIVFITCDIFLPILASCSYTLCDEAEFSI